MNNTEFGCRATIIGSLPYKDPKEACRVVARFLKDIPAWPQLPNRTFLENMYVQYSEGFPGEVVEENRMYVDRSKDSGSALEALYNAYLVNDAEKYPISPSRAAGLHEFLSYADFSPHLVGVKGHVTGPISWGLTVTDENRRSILYDDTLADAAAKLLRLKASWQEKQLRKISSKTIIFVDEPYMASFGSAFVSISPDKVIELLNEVFGGISGISGVHCCGNTDWPVLLRSNARILSFDAYNYAESLALYKNEVKEFLLKKKGAIAWGIVPNESKTIASESVAGLKDRLEAAVAPFARDGISFRQILQQSLVTPSCGLASLTGEEVETVLQLLTELSAAIRKRYL
ncbi:MAG: methionine synthase [Dehalococcoidales bacterium]|nr:methionine synthase [Dehalococcoidales bacterium]